jgi:hypothetical protein
MSETLVLPLLFDAVVAQFAADDEDTAFSFGWKEATKQINQGPGGANRIVFAPGDEAATLGKDLPPDKPGRNPRSLATLEELFTVYVWAVDATDAATLNNERAQYSAARKLYDKWRRAAYLATHTDGDTGLGPMTIVSAKWDLEKVERRFGAQIIVVASIQCAVLDVADFETTAADHVQFQGPITELDTSLQMTITS